MPPRLRPIQKPFFITRKKPPQLQFPCYISSSATRPLSKTSTAQFPPNFSRCYSSVPRSSSPRPHDYEFEPEFDIDDDMDSAVSSSVFDSDFPAATIMSAYKAKALPFGPTKAAKILDHYISLRGGGILPTIPPSVEHGWMLCEEFCIPPSSLFLLGYVLIRSIRPRAGEYFWATGHLLEIASQMGVAGATIFLCLQIKTNKPTKSTSLSALARRDLLEKRYFSRLDEIVKATGNPAACHVLADSYKERKLLVQAKQYYQQAGEGGIGESWLTLGLLYKKEGNTKLSKDCFKEAMALDVPEAFYEFVLLDYPVLLSDKKDDKRGPPSNEHYFYLLKAASSGYLPAAHALGQYFCAHRENQDNLMAKEWYMLAAASRKPQSMLKLAALLRREGSNDLADEWERPKMKMREAQQSGVQETEESDFDHVPMEEGHPRMRMWDRRDKPL